MQVTITSNPPPLASNKRQRSLCKIEFFLRDEWWEKVANLRFDCTWAQGSSEGRTGHEHPAKGPYVPRVPGGTKERCRRERVTSRHQTPLCLLPSKYSFLCRTAGNSFGDRSICASESSVMRPDGRESGRASCPGSWEGVTAWQETPVWYPFSVLA